MDGLQREFEDRAVVVRADILSAGGARVAARFDIDTVPGFVVVDDRGRVLLRRNGAAGVPTSQLRRALRRPS